MDWECICYSLVGFCQKRFFWRIKVKIFVISDTHFGHDGLTHTFGARPDRFSDKIFQNWKRDVAEDDLVIHLGDLVMGDYKRWLDLLPDLPGRKILTLGNHDRKSMHGYMTHGIDFVCDRFNWRMFDTNIVFSHAPVYDGDFDLNIHGHLHDGRHRDVATDDRHCLVSLERTGYGPVPLKTVMDGRVKRSV